MKHYSMLLLSGLFGFLFTECAVFQAATPRCNQRAANVARIASECRILVCSRGHQLTQQTFTITSAAKNVKTKDGVIASGENWKVSKTTLHGGVQEGVEVITVDNGTMQFTVIPTRGMGIYKVESGEMEVGWNSPVKQLVHPHFVDLQDHGGLGWLAGFNEFMCRCGLSFAGHPGEDDGRLLTLHGRVANIPASEVELIIDENDPQTIRLRGLIEEKMFKFGVFELWTEVSTTLGSNTLRFEDKLINRSEYDQEYQVIYHTNVGAPLLEDGAQFVAPVHTLAPFDDYAAKDLAGYDVYQGPTAGYGEQVYCLRTHYNERGMSTVMLKNKAGDRGIAMRYRVETLPCFILWKNTDTLTDGYVTGLEPATGFPYNRSVERESGRVPKIGPGLEKEFVVEIELLKDADKVRLTEDEIREIQGDREPKIRPSAPNGEAEPNYITVQHILIGFDGSVPGKEIDLTQAEASKLAQELLTRAQAGEDFDELVRQFTDDAHPGIYQMANFGQPGDLEPEELQNKIFPRGQMVGAFGNVGFQLKLNEIGLADYDPETSKYGWHIIKRIK